MSFYRVGRIVLLAPNRHLANDGKNQYTFESSVFAITTIDNKNDIVNSTNVRCLVLLMQSAWRRLCTHIILLESCVTSCPHEASNKVSGCSVKGEATMFKQKES